VSARAAFAAAFGIAVSLAAAPARAELVRIETRPGVTLALGVETPSGPAAAYALIFAGGEGALGLDAAGQPTALRNNFLVRARHHLRAAGIGVVLVDAPSDHAAGLRPFRLDPRHAAAIGAAVRNIRQRFGRPVWLVGTSAGTLSVANAAARLAGAERPDGVVLTATITRRTRMTPQSVLDLPLGAYTGPVLVASHRDDACIVTPAADGPGVVAAFAAARPKAFRLFEGGLPPRSDACQAQSPHGFLGIEAEAMGAIAAFIKAPRP
jgi:hypothetical protein